MFQIEQSLSAIRALREKRARKWRRAARVSAKLWDVLGNLPTPQAKSVSDPNRGFGFPISDPIFENLPAWVKWARVGNHYLRLGLEKGALKWRWAAPASPGKYGEIMAHRPLSDKTLFSGPIQG